MPAIFGFWDDLNPINDNCNSECSGNVYYYSSSEKLVVWFENVAHWVTGSGDFSGTSYDFQIIIYPDGSIDINHNSIIGDYSATVGIQNQLGNIGLQVDQYDGSYFTSNVSYKFEKPFSSNWLSITSDNNLSGDLSYLQQKTFYIIVDSQNMPLGNYNATMIIETNIDDVSIPINLEVSDTAGIIGDLNGDLFLNIQDVILLVNIVLSSEIDLNGDLNSDNFVNVLDIVQLVNTILNSN